MKILTKVEEKKLVWRFRFAMWSLGLAKIGRSKLITRLIERFCYFEEGQRLQIIAPYHVNLLMYLDIHSWVERKILSAGYFERWVDTFLERVLKPGYVAIDVGANSGCHTLVMANAVGSKGKVVAFEPNPRMFDRLQANVQLNRFDNVDLCPVALSDQNGIVTLHIPKVGDYNQGLGSIHSANLENASDQIDVPKISLDDWVNQHCPSRIDLIKIDVEGHEMLVFKGAYQTLKNFKPILIFEFSERQWRNAGVATEEVEKLLDDLQYDLYVMRRTITTSIRSGISEEGDILALPR
jgi:FkbM family methyltransferase